MQAPGASVLSPLADEDEAPAPFDFSSRLQEMVDEMAPIARTPTNKIRAKDMARDSTSGCFQPDTPANETRPPPRPRSSTPNAAARSPGISLDRMATQSL